MTEMFSVNILDVHLQFCKMLSLGRGYTGSCVLRNAYESTIISKVS